MSIGEKLRLVIVTPERTLFDEPVSALRFPLYDGDIGVLPGRLPLIGTLARERPFRNTANCSTGWPSISWSTAGVKNT